MEDESFRGTTVAIRCTAGSYSDDETIYRFLVGGGGGDGRLRSINVFCFPLSKDSNIFKLLCNPCLYGSFLRDMRGIA